MLVGFLVRAANVIVFQALLKRNKYGKECLVFSLLGSYREAFASKKFPEFPGLFKFPRDTLGPCTLLFFFFHTRYSFLVSYTKFSFHAFNSRSKILIF